MKKKWAHVEDICILVIQVFTFALGTYLLLILPLVDLLKCLGLLAK